MIIGPIAALSFDTIIGIVAVVVWLIVQGATKRGGPTPPSKPPPVPDDNDPLNPQDDLRRFFQELEKGLSPQLPSAEQSPPPPLQPPPITPVKQRSVSQTHLQRKEVPARRPTPPAKPRSRPIPIPVTPTTPPAPTGYIWNADFPETESGITTLRIADESEHDASQALIAQFRSRKKLRQMIVGAEIMGKPIALRPSAQPLI
jgi:hypothetical protein